MRVISLIFLSCFETTFSAKILGFFPLLLKSHYSVFMPFMDVLNSRGHEVTVVYHSTTKNIPVTNCTSVHLTDVEDNFSILRLEHIEGHPLRLILNLQILWKTVNLYDKIFRAIQVKDLLIQKFDLIITEAFATDIFYGLFYRLNAPIIGINCFELLSWTNYMANNPLGATYLTSTWSSREIPMNFWNRILNTLEVWITTATYSIIIRRLSQNLAEKHLGPLPDLGLIVANTSLLLVNSHFSILGPRPREPTTIEIGGIHLKLPKNLPKELQEVMDKSKHGVIYVSFGTTVYNGKFLTEKEQKFLSVFLKLNQTVLWKTEFANASKFDKVVTSSWFPQQDVLAHPKVVLFISQCGMLSAIESVYSTVPMLCIPLLGDQFFNAKSLESRKVGLTLTMSEIEENNLEGAIKEILSNNLYKENAIKISQLFKDRPMSPTDTAVYWVEYIIRHKGAPHMKSLAKDLAWFRYHGLDIILFSVLIIYFFILITKYVLFNKNLKTLNKKEKTKMN